MNTLSAGRWTALPAFLLMASAGLVTGSPAWAQVGQLQSGPAGGGQGAGDPPASRPTHDQAPIGAVTGMGDINLYPKRVVIDEHNRVASVGLYNRTIATGEYEITLSDMMMTEDGRLLDLTTVADSPAKARVKPASSFLRWSPHRVTLANNESQMVRIMAHVPPNLPPGEYRAHFSAIAVPPVDEGLSIQAATGQQQTTGIGVQITPRFGISIPVIVRVGETTLNVGIAGIGLVTMPDGHRAIAFALTREGTRSAFGDISVTSAGFREPVAQVKGVGVYPEIDRRDVKLAVDPKADPRALAPGAHLTLIYTDDDVTPGKVLARQEFTVP